MHRHGSVALDDCYAELLPLGYQRPHMRVEIAHIISIDNFSGFQECPAALPECLYKLIFGCRFRNFPNHRISCLIFAIASLSVSYALRQRARKYLQTWLLLLPTCLLKSSNLATKSCGARIPRNLL